MVDAKTGRLLTVEEQQAQYIAMLEEECAVNRTVKRQMKEMYEAQIESLSRELAAFRTEYLASNSSLPPPPPTARSCSPAMTSSSTIVALQTRIQELEDELARRNEEDDQDDDQERALASSHSSGAAAAAVFDSSAASAASAACGDSPAGKSGNAPSTSDGAAGEASGSPAADSACSKDSAFVLADAQRRLDSALAELDAERRQHALDCARSAKEEAELRRMAWKSRCRELAALARMRTLALESRAPSSAAGAEDEDSDVWALKRELCAVYGRIDKLADMFLCWLLSTTDDQEASEVTTDPQKQQQQQRKLDSEDAEKLREILLNGQEERREVALAAETARQEVEVVVETVRALTRELEQVRTKVIGVRPEAPAEAAGVLEAAGSEGEKEQQLSVAQGVHGELRCAVARFEQLVDELVREAGRIASSFSVAETVALLEQDKKRLAAELEEAQNRLTRGEAEREFMASTLVQFVEADDKDKRALFMQLAELLRLSMPDRERALARMVPPQSPTRSFLSRLKM